MRWIALLLLLPSIGLAIPVTIHQEGFITDAEGVPHEGAAQLRFSLYEQEQGGAALWFEEHNLNLNAGYYSLLLGNQTAFAGAFDASPRFLGVTIDGVELLPRAQLASVPYALIAQDVVGDINPHSIHVGGQQIIDEAGNWVGPPVPGAGDGVGYDTPQAALAAIKSVDGAGSGLDADTLDGINSAAFLQNGEQVMALVLAADGSGSGLNADRLDGHDSSAFIRTAAQLIELLLTTDGSDSGLDADRLDGHDSTEFLNATDPATATQLLNLLLTVDGVGSGLDADALDGLSAEAFLKAADPAAAAEILSLLLTVDGDGSGLDADLVDGLHASKFMRVDQNTGTTGDLSVDGILSGSELRLTGTLVASRIEAEEIQAKMIRLLPQNTAPEQAGEGSMYFDSTSGEIKFFDGTTWQSIHNTAPEGASEIVILANTGYTMRHPNTVVEQLIDFSRLGIDNTQPVAIQVFRDGVEVPSDVVRWLDNNRKAMLRWKLGGAGMNAKGTAITYHLKLGSGGVVHDMPKEFVIHASSDAAPNSFWWAYNNYDETFGIFTEIGTGYENSDVVIFDKDNDSDYDFAITHDDNGTHGLSVWENDGSERFTKVQTFDSDGNWNGVDAADFNEDGHLDMISNFGYNTTPSPRIYFNNGDGSFTQGPVLGQCSNCDWTRRAIAGDFDGDDNMDFIIGGHNSTCSMCVYWGDGSGNFSAPEAVSNSGAAHSDIHGIAVADADHDGDDDLFTHKSSRNPLFYRSNGEARSFENGAAFIPAGWTPNNVTSSWYDLAIWDVNKDGTLDMTGSDWDNNGRAFAAFGQYNWEGGYPIAWDHAITDIHTAGTTCMEFTGPNPNRIKAQVQYNNTAVGSSCLDILNNGKSFGSSIYFIDVDGNDQGLDPFPVYCDMDHNGGGWTLVLSAGIGKNLADIATRNSYSPEVLASIGPNQPPNNILYKFSDEMINLIKNTNDNSIGYLVVTPGSGDSGPGTLGAQSFHRGDCVFQMATKEANLSAECNQQVANLFTDTPTWRQGGHWWYNRDQYIWAFGYQGAERGFLGDSSCYNGGEGLGVHTDHLAPFHRGWCNTVTWGQVWVR